MGSSVFPGGIDSVPDIVNPTVTDANVTPTLSQRLNLATDAMTAVQTWLINNMSAIFETPGVIKPYGGSSAPPGYLLCQGQAVSRTTFPNLFAAIGTNFGAGDGSTTFNVPNGTDRTLIGVGVNPLGALVGSNLAGLSVNNLPAHNHLMNDPGHTHSTSDPGHTHSISDPGHAHAVSDPGHQHNVISSTSGTAGPGSTTFSTATSLNQTLTSLNITNIGIFGSVTNLSIVAAVSNLSIVARVTGVTTQNTGLGTTFSIQQASLVVNWIIKT
jgi:microcystin-dependent protein